MAPQKLVLLTSENGVVLSKVTLAQEASSKTEPVTSYVVESLQTNEIKAFEKRTDALECFENEVERNSR